MAIFSSLFLAMTVVPALTGFLSAYGHQTEGEVNSAGAAGVGRWYQDGWNSANLTVAYRRTLTGIRTN